VIGQISSKPDLKLVRTKNIANQQIVGPIVAARPSGSGRLAGSIDDEFVSLQQTEQLNGHVFAATGAGGQ